jgi:hypothetical protein
MRAEAIKQFCLLLLWQAIVRQQRRLYGRKVPSGGNAACIRHVRMGWMSVRASAQDLSP